MMHDERELQDFLHNPQVLIEITSHCNFHCSYCLSPLIENKRFMPLETVKRVVDQAVELTRFPLRLHTDGEPMSHPDFFKIVDYIVSIKQHDISLATNGSLLTPKLLRYPISILISVSTDAEEFSKRSSLSYEKYLRKIGEYVTQWYRTDSRQRVNFQLIYALNPGEAGYAEYDEKKIRFMREMVRELLESGNVTEVSSPESDVYTLEKADGSCLKFIKMRLARGGLYPVDGKVVDQGETGSGFCDSPWKRITVLSNGTIGFCCIDLSGATAFATIDDLEHRSLKELWEHHPDVRRIRDGFLKNEVLLDVCRRCLAKKPNHTLRVGYS